METSTILFIAVLAIGFVFLRWLITPIPHGVPPEVEQIRNQSNRARANGSSDGQSYGTTSGSDPSGTDASNSGTRSRSDRNRPDRAITDSMVEVVQAIAPQLTVSQIRYDLQRTGSVEVTVNRYMETGSLPFPPGELAAPQPAATANRSPNDGEDPSHNIPPSTISLNLLDKYGLHDEIDDDNQEKSSSTWGTSRQERSSNLQKKRQEMILNARKRLANQLQNDISDQL